MKTRTTLFLTLAVIVTLSFTLVSVNSEKKQEKESVQVASTAEPIGGFISEEKF